MVVDCSENRELKKEVMTDIMIWLTYSSSVCKPTNHVVLSGLFSAYRINATAKIVAVLVGNIKAASMSGMLIFLNTKLKLTKAIVQQYNQWYSQHGLP